MPGPLIKHSHSALEQLLSCERRLWFEKIAKVPQAPNVYFSVGNFYHAVIADALTPGPEITDAWLLERVRREEAGAWLQDVPNDRLLAEAKAVRSSVASIRPFVRPVAIEQWFRTPYLAKVDCLSECTPIAGADGVPVGSSARPAVLDWKLVFGSRRKERSPAQLALYCLSTGAKDAGFVEFFRDGRRPFLSMTSFNDYDLARWRRYFDAQFLALDRRGPEEAAYRLADPNNPLCSSRWCPHWRYCEGGEGDRAARPGGLGVADR